MKSKIVLLVICAILSGCGLGKRGYSSDSESGKTTENPLSFNLEGVEPELLQSFSGSNYAILHTAAARKFPAQIQQMESETEIGTLDMNVVEEAYQPEYDDEPISNQLSHREQSSIKVYAIKNKAGTISLGIKWDKVKELAPVKTPVEVKFAKGPYCSRVQIFLNQLKDKVAIPDQFADCDPSGNCNAVVKIEIPKMYGGGDRPLSFHLQNPLATWKCIESKTTHLKSTSRQNKRWVRDGVVRLK